MKSSLLYIYALIICLNSWQVGFNEQLLLLPCCIWKPAFRRHISFYKKITNEDLASDFFGLWAVFFFWFNFFWFTSFCGAGDVVHSNEFWEETVWISSSIRHPIQTNAILKRKHLLQEKGLWDCSAGSRALFLLLEWRQLFVRWGQSWERVLRMSHKVRQYQSF